MVIIEIKMTGRARWGVREKKLDFAEAWRRFLVEEESRFSYFYERYNI